MAFEERCLQFVKSADVILFRNVRTFEDSRIQVSGDHELAVIAERNPASIEEMVDVRGKQQTVAAVNLLGVVGILPRLDMARSEVRRICDARDAATDSFIRTLFRKMPCPRTRF